MSEVRRDRRYWWHSATFRIGTCLQKRFSCRLTKAASRASRTIIDWLETQLRHASALNPIEVLVITFLCPLYKEYLFRISNAIFDVIFGTT
jgi:hypothetical protein